MISKWGGLHMVQQPYFGDKYLGATYRRNGLHAHNEMQIMRNVNKENVKLKTKMSSVL